MLVVTDLPFEILLIIAEQSTELWYKCCLIFRPVGLYSLNKLVQVQTQKKFTVTEDIVIKTKFGQRTIFRCERYILVDSVIKGKITINSISGENTPEQYKFNYKDEYSGEKLDRIINTITTIRNGTQYHIYLELEIWRNGRLYQEIKYGKICKYILTVESKKKSYEYLPGSVGPFEQGKESELHLELWEHEKFMNKIDNKLNEIELYNVHL